MKFWIIKADKKGKKVLKQDLIYAVNLEEAQRIALDRENISVSAAKEPEELPEGGEVNYATN